MLEKYCGELRNFRGRSECMMTQRGLKILLKGAGKSSWFSNNNKPLIIEFENFSVFSKRKSMKNGKEE